MFLIFPEGTLNAELSQYNLRSGVLFSPPRRKNSSVQVKFCFACKVADKVSAVNSKANGIARHFSRKLTCMQFVNDNVQSLLQTETPGGYSGFQQQQRQFIKAFP